MVGQEIFVMNSSIFDISDISMAHKICLNVLVTVYVCTVID